MHEQCKEQSRRHSLGKWEILFQLLFSLAILLACPYGHARNKTFADHGSLSFGRDGQVLWRFQPEERDGEGHFFNGWGTLEMTVKQGSQSWKVSVPTQTRTPPEWFNIGGVGLHAIRVPWVVRGGFRVEGSVVLLFSEKSKEPAFLVGPQLEMNAEPPVFGRINGRRQSAALLINASALEGGLLFEGEYHGGSQREYLRCSKVVNARIFAVDLSQCSIER